MSNAIANMSQSDLYKAAALAEGYESVPVDIETFVNDPQYLGQLFAGNVYPYWMERLKKIYPNPFYSPAQEILITGCIGAGKSVTFYTQVCCEDTHKLAKDVTLNDKVLGTDGCYYPVLGIFPQGVLHTYTLDVQLQSPDGEPEDEPYDSVTTSDDHIWTVYENGDKKDMLTSEIVEGLKAGRTFCLPTLYGDPGRYFCGWHDAGFQECVCFHVGSPDHLFAVNNGTFTHNTTVSLIGILYDLYRITLLRNPHKKWHLIPTTHIVFTLITATMDLAGVVLADQIIDAISASPYFCSKLMPGKGDHIDEDMFPHRVGISFGSRQRHSMGKAVIGAILDEANFQDAVADQAVKNYNSIKRRMESRFMSKGGELPCRLWIVSSRTDNASFLESHIDANRNNPKAFIYEPAIWEIKAHLGIYSGKTFPVFIGSDVEQPRILHSEKEMDDYMGRTIQVPVELQESFENNLPGALQDLAGVATRNGVNLIYNVEALDRSMCLDNCMKSDELHLTLDGDDQIADFYKGNLPPGKYYVHLDGGLKSDRFGFAMTRVTEHISVDTVSAVDGMKTSRISPSVETPLVFGIKALPGSEVPFWKVRQFLVYLRSQKVSIALVTCDGYQSADMMQLLIKLGFNAKYASVDRTKDPYLKLSSNILLGLIKMPRSPILRNELMNLQNLPKKIDHPATIMVDGKQVAGGKDIADAVAASSYEAIGASMTLGASSLINMQKSAPVHMNMRERQEFVMERFLKMPVRR